MFIHKRKHILSTFLAVDLLSWMTLLAMAVQHCPPVEDPLRRVAKPHSKTIDFRLPDQPYSANSACLWKIKSSKVVIKLNFTHLDVESSPGCKKDFVKIIVGDFDTNKDNPFATLCGNGTRDLLHYVPTGLLFIFFSSDGSGNFGGFTVQFSELKRTDLLDIPSYVFCPWESVPLQMKATEELTVLTSPGYPNNGDSNMICGWKFKNSGLLELTFIDYGFQDDEECLNNYVSVFENQYVEGTTYPIAHFCDQYKANRTYYIQNEEAYIYYVAKSVNKTRGFKLLIRVVNESTPFLNPSYVPCEEVGFNLTTENEQGVLHPPNYPADYDVYLTCVWRISKEEDSVTWKLNISFYDIGPDQSQPCYGDSLFITHQYGEIVQLCGRSVEPWILETNSSEIYLTFMTYGHVKDEGRGGFYMTYEKFENCT